MFLLCLSLIKYIFLLHSTQMGYGTGLVWNFSSQSSLYNVLHWSFEGKNYISFLLDCSILSSMYVLVSVGGEWIVTSSEPQYNMNANRTLEEGFEGKIEIELRFFSEHSKIWLFTRNDNNHIFFGKMNLQITFSLNKNGFNWLQALCFARQIQLIVSLIKISHLFIIFSGPAITPTTDWTLQPLVGITVSLSQVSSFYGIFSSKWFWQVTLIYSLKLHKSEMVPILLTGNLSNSRNQISWLLVIGIYLFNYGVCHIYMCFLHLKFVHSTWFIRWILYVSALKYW